MILKIRHPVRVLALLLCATTASAQENRGTAQQRAACAPDAFRLCAGYIPDPTGVEQCLRQNESKLSDGCGSVFEQGAGAAAGTSIQGTGAARSARLATFREPSGATRR